MTCRSGWSLRSGNGSLSESANVFCEKESLALIARIWTSRSWNFWKSAFLAERFFVHVPPKSAT
jgi:hypothetical protein